MVENRFFADLDTITEVCNVKSCLLFAERQVLREKLSDLLAEKARQIIEIMDKPDYTPKLQNQGQLDTIYESEFKDIQPYLFRVSC